MNAFRSLGIVVVVFGLGVVACDSNGGGPPPSDLEGTYEIQEMQFVVPGSGINNFDIYDDTLNVSDGPPPSPRMVFFGGSASVDLIYRLQGSSSGSSRISGQFSTREGRVRADFTNAREESRSQLLLPEVVVLQIEQSGARLVVDQEVRDVDLESYSPGRYGGLRQNVNGRLRMELERVQN